MLGDMSTARFHPAMRYACAFMLLAAAALAGCSSVSSKRHVVRITSAVDPEKSSGFSYTLAPDPPGKGADVFHTQVKERVRTALAQRGMYESPTPARADVVVSFDYGEYPPQTQVTTVTEPVFVEPGMSSGIMGPGALSSSSRNPLGSSRSQVVMVESIRVTQTQEKYFRLDARENRLEKARIWSVDASIEDEGTPIAECIPAMVDAIIEYIGYRTPKPEEVVIRLGADGGISR